MSKTSVVLGIVGGLSTLLGLMGITRTGSNPLSIAFFITLGLAVIALSVVVGRRAANRKALRTN